MRHGESTELSSFEGAGSRSEEAVRGSMRRVRVPGGEVTVRRRGVAVQGDGVATVRGGLAVRGGGVTVRRSGVAAA